VELLLLSICVSFGWVSFKTHQLWQLDIHLENMKQAKGNECSQYRSTAAIFSSSLMIDSPLYHECVHNMHNMPRHDKVKIKGANGQTGGKNSSSTSVLTAFISFGLFNIFLLDV
jgi:hypothetical protein